MEKQDFKFYYEFYKLDNNGNPIEIQNSVPFDHEDLEYAKEEIVYEFDDLNDINENDVAIITYSDGIGGKIIEAKIYIDKQWEDLSDSEFLTNNKFRHISTSETFSYLPPVNTLYKKPKVETWDDIIKNFRAFQEIDNGDNSQTFRKYSQFFHWYYWPEEELFAPSKFLGYKDTTIANYDSSGSGGETQNALSKFFTKLDKNSDEFKRLYRELQQVSKNNFKKDLSYKILDGKGGIYIPKTN